MSADGERAGHIRGPLDRAAPRLDVPGVPDILAGQGDGAVVGLDAPRRQVRDFPGAAHAAGAGDIDAIGQGRAGLRTDAARETVRAQPNQAKAGQFGGSARALNVAPAEVLRVAPLAK